jgi:hypothetical protein
VAKPPMPGERQKIDFFQNKGTFTSSNNSNFGVFVHFEVREREILDDPPKSVEIRRKL